MIRRLALIPMGMGVLASSAFSADDKNVKPPAAPKVQVQKAPPVRVPPVPRPGAARGMQGAPSGAGAPRPGEQMLDRLIKMSPEQRDKALQNLEPQRRLNIERRINEIQKLPAGTLNLNLMRLERLNHLPQPRQGQVRRSINQFSALPEDRKAQMSRELQRISALPDEDRRAFMNTEEFRNRYSANEQQIMSNLSEITPEAPPHE
jgi:hypothetical protein